MVLRLMKNRWKDLLFAFLITVILLFPYLTMDLLAIEHDTFFHVSRIEQLSVSISKGNFFPAIYPYENNGYGYASPLFYCDVFLIIPALLHLLGCSLAFCYKFSVFCASFLSTYSMILLVSHISKKRSAAWISGCAYLFANYRITDIYVRGALGEIFAFAFLPVMILGMYRIMEEDDPHIFTLACGITGLALSHNLTFLMGSLLCALLFFMEYKKITKEKVKLVGCAVALAFGLSAFFTLPMIEQLQSQDFIVDYYGDTSDLASNAMDLWQYFVNQTIFGYSGNDLDHSITMTVNIGWFLTFSPLTWFLLPKVYRKEHTFVTKVLIIGYICMILPSSLLPWDELPLKIIQFPWRFNTIAMVLLSIPAGIGCCQLLQKRWLHLGLISLLCLECLYHVLPEYERTFGLSSDMTWSDVLEGDLCDPYYSAYYVRVELAGGDYLPLASPDFRNRSTSIKDHTGNDLDITYVKQGSSLTFSTSALSEDQQLVLPLTWYKGYHVYRIDQGKKTEVPSCANYESMLSFEAEKDQEYIVQYENTMIRNISFIITGITLVTYVFACIKRKELL